jgi:hypothetical protein
VLTLNDVLGANLDKNKVRGVFRYSCERTFFEGEGVTRDSIACIPGQHLGLIKASYNFYTYRSHFDGNFPAGDVAFPDPICGRNSLLQYQCTGNTPELRYGLYKEPVAPFVVAVSMTRAPVGENLTGLYGYGVVPDNGVCPPGLEAARPWVAEPQTISAGAIDGTNPPSSFVNFGDLNNTVVETLQPFNFTVSRQANLTPCANDGSCVNASFGGNHEVQNVLYTPLTPQICVIPSSLLGGIF